MERLKPTLTIQSQQLPKGILHSDIFPDNALFEGEDLVAIIDWEEICYGELLIDIAMTVVGCCYPPDKNTGSTSMISRPLME